MTPEERAETEARAESQPAARRPLAQALAGYHAIGQAFPEDEGVQRKLAELKESVDPIELRHPKANFAEPAPAVATPQTPEQEGERLFAQGDYPGAIAAYRRALALRPDAELLKERLGELFRLVQAPRRAPAQAGAPQPDAAPSTPGTRRRRRPVPRAPRSHQLAPARLTSGHLERTGSRRGPPSAGASGGPERSSLNGRSVHQRASGSSRRRTS